MILECEVRKDNPMWIMSTFLFCVWMMKYHMQTENDTFSCWSNYSNVLQQIKLSIASGGHRVTYLFEVDKESKIC